MSDMEIWRHTAVLTGVGLKGQNGGDPPPEAEEIRDWMPSESDITQFFPIISMTPIKGEYVKLSFSREWDNTLARAIEAVKLKGGDDYVSHDGEVAGGDIGDWKMMGVGVRRGKGMRRGELRFEMTSPEDGATKLVAFAEWDWTDPD